MAVVLSKLDRNNPSKSPQPSNPLHGRRVLIAEDNPMQRKKLRELYESMGFLCVGEVENGLDCLEMAEKTKPDLISLDILMPVMHGMETLGYLREAKSTAAIVLVSAMGNVEAITEVKAKGHLPEAVFSKKDTREMFIQVLTEIFEGDSGEAAETESEAESGSSDAQGGVSKTA